jgi:hypothetical protein
MHHHGKGPKLVFVRRHPRWLRGKRKHVEEFRRGHDHPLGHRKTNKQLDFGFETRPEPGGH